MSPRPRPERGSGARGGARRGPGGDRLGAGARRDQAAQANPGSGPRRGRPRPSAPGRGERGDARRGPRGLGGEQVEGRQAVRELLVAGRRRVKEVLLANDLEPAPVIEDIVELAEARRVPVHHIGRGKLETLTATAAAQGVLARAQQLPEHDLDELAGRRRPAPAFLLALDGVTDPGNLGAVLRSAEGAGASGVVLPRHRAVHVTPAVTKAAAGAVEYVPMALVGGLPAALQRLDALGVWVVGLDSHADRPIYELPLGDEPVCLVLGAEGSGLSRLVRQRCHAVASIPLAGQLNSLNVAAAGAVACFAVARARAGREAPGVDQPGAAGLGKARPGEASPPAPPGT